MHRFNFKGVGQDSPTVLSQDEHVAFYNLIHSYGQRTRCAVWCSLNNRKWIKRFPLPTGVKSKHELHDEHFIAVMQIITILEPLNKCTEHWAGDPLFNCCTDTIIPIYCGVPDVTI